MHILESWVRISSCIESHRSEIKASIYAFMHQFFEFSICPHFICASTYLGPYFWLKTLRSRRWKRRPSAVLQNTLQMKSPNEILQATSISAPFPNRIGSKLLAEFSNESPAQLSYLAPKSRRIGELRSELERGFTGYRPISRLPFAQCSTRNALPQRLWCTFLKSWIPTRRGSFSSFLSMCMALKFLNVPATQICQRSCQSPKLDTPGRSPGTVIDTSVPRSLHYIKPIAFLLGGVLFDQTDH